MWPDRNAGARPEPYPELFRKSVRELSAALRNRTFSACELLDHYLQRITRLNPQLNAFVHLDIEGATKAASASDVRLQAGQPLSTLDGIPVAIKDNLLMRNCPAVWGSPLYRNFVADHDEVPVAKLRSSGAVLLGKTNVPEFAMSGFTGNAVHGVTRNPWDLTRTPGGSSGGAVAAVAAGLAPLALATDGGGSIRRPAAYTNLVGLKPTIGRILRGNGFPQLIFDCEVVGPIARRVDDARLLFAAIAQRFGTTKSDWHTPLRRPRVLYVDKIDDAPVDPEVLRLCTAAADRFVLLGHHVTRGNLPFPTEAAISAWQAVTSAGFSFLARQHEGFAAAVSPDFAAKANMGARMSAADYCAAVETLLEFRATLAGIFEQIDLIMTPTVAAQPWPAEEAFPQMIGGQAVGPRGHAVFTPWVNACGHPAIALPAGTDAGGLPAGFQLIAQNSRDEFLLDVAEEYELAFPWAQHWPTYASM
jgi:aspartyl-tRNA(Asn)/glutamyl-tRNA(Gln) amidotransferase subunit A